MSVFAGRWTLSRRGQALLEWRLSDGTSKSSQAGGRMTTQTARDKSPWWVYVFYIDGSRVAKIGSTSDIEGRLYGLVWGRQSVSAPLDVHTGYFAHKVPADTKRAALAIERACQDLLHHSVRACHGRGGRCEWFDVGREEAVAALNDACNGEWLEVEIPSSLLAAARREYKRRKSEYGSISDFIVSAVARHIRTADTSDDLCRMRQNAAP